MRISPIAVLCLTILVTGCSHTAGTPGGSPAPAAGQAATPPGSAAAGASTHGAGAAAAQAQPAGAQGQPAPGHPVSLPIEFRADRFVLAPRTPAGETVTLVADTGGGLYLSREAARRLHLAVSQIAGDGGQKMDAAALPAFDPAATIPPLEALGGKLPILPEEATRGVGSTDGLVGQAWFRDRTWTFDYPGKRLLWRAPGDLPAHDASHQVALGFPENALGVSDRPATPASRR